MQAQRGSPLSKTETPAEPGTVEALTAEVLALRAAVVEAAAPLIERFERESGPAHAGVANLAHYLALRHHDLRPLQRQLMWRGLSSLGRLESRVLPTLMPCLPRSPR